MEEKRQQKHYGLLQSIETGWLCCFDGGEFGSEFWHIGIGAETYKIADLRVTGLLSDGEVMYATAGLSHLGVSSGTIVRLTKNSADHWIAQTIAIFGNYEPLALFKIGKNTIIVVTTGPAIQLTIGDVVTKTIDWNHRSLYGNAICDDIFSCYREDEDKVYFGCNYSVMRYSVDDGSIQYLISPNERKSDGGHQLRFDR
jgi:hypothetical protein